jgi:hypothetical protein
LHYTPYSPKFLTGKRNKSNWINVILTSDAEPVSRKHYHLPSPSPSHPPIPRSSRNQKPLIVNSFGFTVLQTTLLTCVDGVISIATVGIGVNVAAWTEQRAITAFAWKSTDVLGAILVQTLPWGNKIGLLFSLWVAGEP